MTEETFSFRWGVDLLDNGHTQIPNLFIRNYHRVCNYREFALIIHLSSYAFEKPGSQCRPSLNTVAQEMGVSDDSVRRLLRGLEKRRLLKVERVPSQPNIYNLEGFSKAVMSHVWTQGAFDVCNDADMCKNADIRKNADMCNDADMVSAKMHRPSMQICIPKKKEEKEDHSNILESLKNLLLTRLPKNVYNHLFMYAQVVSFEDGVLTVQLHNSQVLEVVQDDTYKSIIDSCVNDLGNVKEVAFVAQD